MGGRRQARGGGKANSGRRGRRTRYEVSEGGYKNYSKKHPSSHYKQKSERKKLNFQHGSIVFGTITLAPYPALQLAERGKKRFFPLARESRQVGVSAVGSGGGGEGGGGWREGEVVRARLLRQGEALPSLAVSYQSTRRGFSQETQKSVHNDAREGVQERAWQDVRQDVRQGAREEVRQEVRKEAQKEVRKEVRKEARGSLWQERGQGAVSVYNSSTRKFRNFARVLLAHPFESLGRFDGDVAFLCELGLRQHAAYHNSSRTSSSTSSATSCRTASNVGRIEALGEQENSQLEAEVKAIVPYRYKVEDKREDLREDLRELPFITIDGEDARDFDDAVMAEQIELDTKTSQAKQSQAKQSSQAKFRLRIAIADVALYVQEGSLLDKIARARGNSIYLPDRVVAMLPARLSENLCSLQPQRERPCLMVEIIIDSCGRVLKQRIARVVIKSKARVTYQQVERILDAQKQQTEETEVEKLIANLYLAWQALATARAERGALEIDRSEPLPIIEKTKNGRINCIGIEERHNSNARRIIEDFMIAANVAIASHLGKSLARKASKSQSKGASKGADRNQSKGSGKSADKGLDKGSDKGSDKPQSEPLGFVIRNHEPPTPDKWQALQDDLGRLKVASLLLSHEGSPRVGQVQKGQSQEGQSQEGQSQEGQSEEGQSRVATSVDRLAAQRRRQLRALLQAVREKTLKAATHKEKTPKVATHKEKIPKVKKSAKENDQQVSEYLPLLVAEAVLRAQSQARYATLNPQHFALALPNYCHFTSPIRRYADLLVHRAVLATLETDGDRDRDGDGDGEISSDKVSTELCEHLVECERSAIALERITFQRIACHYLKERIGEVVEGVVLRVMPFGFFVRLRDFAVEGIVTRDNLDHYRFQYASEQALVGTRIIEFGSRLKVEIYESDPIAARLELRLKE